MDVHIFRLYFDPHLPEIVPNILLFPWFLFRAMGPDYLNQETWLCVKLVVMLLG